MFSTRNNEPGGYVLTLVKSLIVFFLLLPLLSCSSAPKEVTDAWRKFKAVKVGMTREEVLELVGAPGQYSTNAPGSTSEFWLEGQAVAYSAVLAISYNDGRVRHIKRQRSHVAWPNRPGASYL